MLLALAALAEGREVVVSRGELLEIGDGFRIPDVLARSGARLVEVGTTNRTRAADYERAIGPETAVLLRVHQSNFRVVGFTELPVDRASSPPSPRRHGLPLVDDLGSGALVPLPDEPLVRDALAAGADLVCFSGDKLLGGPQAGIVVGRAELVERLRRHPLQRALRADKLTLAALEGTLVLYLDPERALREVPVAADGRRGGGGVRTPRRAPGGADRRRGRGDGRPRRRRGAAARRAAELRLRGRGGARRAPPAGRAAGGRGRPRRPAPARLPHARRRRAGRGRRRGRRGAPKTDERGASSGTSLRGAIATRAAADRRGLGVADALRDGPAARSEVAAEVGADADTLERYLRALASDGVFAEVEPGVYREHRGIRAARPRHRPGVRSRSSSAASGTEAIGRLDASGRRAFDGDFWAWLADHPRERALFDLAMEEGTERRVERLDAV